MTFRTIAAGLVALACAHAAPRTAAPPATDGKIPIAVTEKGFEPDHLTVKAGVPTTFVFTRETDQTCATNVVIQTGAGDPIQKDLPLHRPVEVTVTFAKPGDLEFACSMDMVTGVISVQ